MDYVEVYAIKWEWVCPECNTRHTEEDHPDFVKCGNPQCYTEFEVMQRR